MYIFISLQRTYFLRTYRTPFWCTYLYFSCWVSFLRWQTPIWLIGWRPWPSSPHIPIENIRCGRIVLIEFLDWNCVFGSRYGRLWVLKFEALCEQLAERLEKEKFDIRSAVVRPEISDLMFLISILSILICDTLLFHFKCFVFTLKLSCFVFIDQTWCTADLLHLCEELSKDGEHLGQYTCGFTGRDTKSANTKCIRFSTST